MMRRFLPAFSASSPHHQCSCFALSSLTASSQATAAKRFSSSAANSSSSTTTTNLENPELLQDPLQVGAWDSTRLKRNVEFTEEVNAKITALVNKVRAGLEENEKPRKLHVSRGKLLVRDRIKHLIDPGTEFFEFSPLAAYDVYPNDYPPCGGVVTGVGKIFNTRCVIMANDATVKGGIYYPVGAKKQMRAQRIAQQNSLPCVYLVDSGGGNLAMQAEGFADEQHFGRLFFNQANMSALGIPQISCVMGSCTAGGAYIPCMSDETIMVKNVATIFLGGPQLVFAATGEMNTPEELGGAEMHCAHSGVADHFAENDAHALVMSRRVVRNLNRKHQKRNVAPLDALDGAANKAAKPLYDSKDIAGFVDPIDLFSSSSSSSSSATSEQPPVNTKGVISRLVDASHFDEFKARYGINLTCGFSEIEGIQVGIVADNGCALNEDAGLKGAHFIQMCAQRDVPMLFLQGGGTFAAQDPAATPNAGKHAGKMISAIATTSQKVAKITVNIRGCISDGAFATCGRAMNPRFLFSWPTAKTSIARDAIAHPETAAEKEAAADPKLAHARIKKQLSPTLMSSTFVSARIFDDGVIAPSETRSVVAEALRCCLCFEEAPAPADSPRYSVFRM